MLNAKLKTLKCDCNDDTFLGIPCRHQFALFIRQEVGFDVLPFEKRWVKTFYQEKEDLKDSLPLQNPEIQVI